MLSAETKSRIEQLVAARGPLLVCSDLDGTLAPIVEQTREARVPRETIAVLERLAKHVRVAIITGRDLNTARRLVPSENVAIVGSHGLEPSFDSPLLPEVDRIHLAPALEAVEQRVISAVPAAFRLIERKAISTAFHYRQSPELEPDLRRALEPLPGELRLREGRMVLEVLPNREAGKDHALLALANHFKAHAFLVIGDDVTDVAMFRAARSLRERGDEVLLVGVSGGDETPLEIAELSDLLVGSTEEVRELLDVVARTSTR